MSKEYIISVPDYAGFVEFSYIRGGRKYESHYAYRSMERLVRCRECKHGEYKADYDEYECHSSGCGLVYKADDFCSYGEREGE